MAFIFFTGGIRSGKTRLAQIWAEAAAPERVWLAAADNRNIGAPSLRGQFSASSWHRLDEPLEPLNRLKLFRKEYPDYQGSLVFASIGVWISNLMAQNLNGTAILRRVNTLALMFNELALPCAIVSEQAGQTPPPASAVTRKYIELTGVANQILAKNCHCAIMANCGLPVVLKGAMPAILDRTLRC